MNRPSSHPDLVSDERETPGDQPSNVTLMWLLAGACAGPVLIVSSLVQGSVRTGFDLREHPPSALALGSAGVVQQATFVLAGLLLVAGAVGMRHRDVSRWAARLVAVLGCALTMSGLFTMDPAFGFPPGTPPGVGDTVSWHAAIHGVLFPVGFAALVGAAVLTGRRYGRAKRRGLQLVAYAAAAASLALSMWPNLGGQPDGRFLPLWFGVTIGYLWTSLMFLDLARSASGEDNARVGKKANA
jgi:drug/metabolite transporter (DMT)-like permease